MRFAREKSLLLAALALIAPLPLPFNEVVGWASVIAYLLAVTVFALRTLDGRETPLPYWAMNVLGALYLPFLFLDLTLLRQGRFLQPLVHLAMFALVVKLFGMHREKDKWHVFLTVFFVFVAAAGTSVHPSVSLYLVAYLALSTLTLIKFAGLHSIAEFRRQEVQAAGFSVTGLVSLIVVAVILASIPLFFVFPRLRRPYVWSPTAGAGSTVQVSGFSDRMDLDVIGRVRTSRAVLLRFTYENAVGIPPESRFKAAVFDRYDEGIWQRTPRPTLSVSRGRDGLFHLARERSSTWMAVWQRTMGNSRILLPVQARAVDLPGNGLVVEDSGAVHFMLPPPGTIEFRVGLGTSPRVAAPGPNALAGSVPELDPAGISPRIDALAAEVIGEGETIERVTRIEQHLLRNYDYTVELGSRPTDQPVERFLFETRAGHCEYFVSAMVLMLRSQGIPARVVTGYLGADFNRWQQYFIVRQSHAHAWVEAWIEGHGWRVFDPTPPDGRPVVSQTGLGVLFGQVWDSILFRWDRYVLTYGFYDQVGAFIRLRELLEGFWSFFDREKNDDATSVEESPTIEGERANTGERSAPFRPKPLHGLPFVMVALAAVAWFWWRRERLSATLAYRRLRMRLLRASPETSEATPPLEVERRLVDLFPDARDDARRLVDLYLEESFGGRRLDPEEIEEVRQALRRSRRSWKKSA